MNQEEYDVSQGSHLSPEVEDVPLVLLPCVSCKRTFRPEALAKHSKVCEKTLMKKRKTFDSSKQRLQGTEVESFATSPPVAKAATRKSRAKEKLDLEKAIQAVKRPLPDPNPLVRPSDHDECPHCGRFFGPKAFERHTQFCKEQQLKLKTTPIASQEAKERLKVRTSYKGPLTNKVLNRDRYQPKRDPSPMSSEHRDDASRSRGLTRNASLRSSFRSRTSDTTPPPPLRRTMTQISSTRTRRSREKEEEVIASPQQEGDSQRQGMPRLYSREHPDRKVKSPRWNSSVSLSNKSLFNKDVDRNSLSGGSFAVFMKTDKSSNKQFKTEKKGQDLGIVNITNMSVSTMDSFQQNKIICDKNECPIINEGNLKSSYHPEEYHLISDPEENKETPQSSRSESICKHPEKHMKPKLSRTLRSNNSIKFDHPQVEGHQSAHHQSTEGVFKCINVPESFTDQQNSCNMNEYSPDNTPNFHVLESKTLYGTSNSNVLRRGSDTTDVMDKPHRKGPNSLGRSIPFDFHKNVYVDNSILDPLTLSNNRFLGKNEKKVQKIIRDNSFRNINSSPEPVISIDCNNLSVTDKKSAVDDKIMEKESFYFSNANQETQNNVKIEEANFIQLTNSKEHFEEKLSTKNDLFLPNLRKFSSANNNIISEENNYRPKKSVRPQSCTFLPDKYNEDFPPHANNMAETDISSAQNRSDLPKLLVPLKLWRDITETVPDNVIHPKSIPTFDSTVERETLQYVNKSPQNSLDSVKGVQYHCDKINTIVNEVKSPPFGDALLSLSPILVNNKLSTNPIGNGNYSHSCFVEEHVSESGVTESSEEVNSMFVCKGLKNDHFTNCKEISGNNFFYTVDTLEENNNSHQRGCDFPISLQEENRNLGTAPNFICLDENQDKNILFDHNQPKCLNKTVSYVNQSSQSTENVKTSLSKTNSFEKRLMSQNIIDENKSHLLKSENSPSGSYAFQINEVGNLDPFENAYQNDEHLFRDLGEKFVDSQQTGNCDIYVAPVGSSTFAHDHDHQDQFDTCINYIQDFQTNISEDRKCNQVNNLKTHPQLGPLSPDNSFRLTATSEHYFPNSFCQMTSDLPKKSDEIFLQGSESIKMVYPLLEFVTVTRGTACQLNTNVINNFEELKDFTQEKMLYNRAEVQLLEEEELYGTSSHCIVKKTSSYECSLNKAEGNSFTKSSNPLEIKRRPSTHPICTTDLLNNSEKTQCLLQSHKKKCHSLDSKSFEIVFSSECSDFLRKTFENFNSRGLPQEYKTASFSSSGVDFIENCSSAQGGTDEDNANNYSLYFVDRDDSKETTKINPTFIEKQHVFKEDLLKSKNIEQSGSPIHKNLICRSIFEGNEHEVCCLDNTIKNCPNVFHKPFQQAHFNTEVDTGELPIFPLTKEETLTMYLTPSELESFSEDSLEREMSDTLSRDETESTYSDSLSCQTPEKSPILFWNNRKLFYPSKELSTRHSGNVDEKCNLNNINEKIHFDDKHFPHKSLEHNHCNKRENFSGTDFGFDFQVDNKNNSYNKLKPPCNSYKFHKKYNVLPPITIYKKVSKETEKISVKSYDLSSQILYENTQVIKENLCNIDSSGCASESENSIPLSSSCDDENTFCFKHCSKKVEYFHNGNDYHTVKTSVYELPKFEKDCLTSSSKIPQYSLKSSRFLPQNCHNSCQSFLNENALKLPSINMVRSASRAPNNGEKLNYHPMTNYYPTDENQLKPKVNVSNPQLYSKPIPYDSIQHSEAHSFTDQEGHCNEKSRLPYLMQSRNSLMNTTHYQDSSCIQPRKSSLILERPFPNSAHPPYREGFANLTPILHTSSVLCDSSSLSKYSMKVEENSKHSTNETEKHKNFKNFSHNSIDSAYSSLTRSAGGGDGEPAQPELPGFCHECGTRYPVITAKFCCNCGMKRIVL